MRVRLLAGLVFAAFALTAGAQIPASVQSEVVEFYNQTLDHYFITAEPKEISDLDTGVHVGWTRTGYRFPGVKAASTQANTLPVCRFYGRPEAKIDSHFYSAKVSECDDVKRKFPDAWQFEADEVFRAFAVDPLTGNCPASTAPVYRLWNQRPDVNHRYTDQLFVYQQMVAKGYQPEGDGNPSLPVAFCTPAGGSIVPAPAAGSPSCTLSASNGSPALGTTITLTALCSDTPTSYLWAGCTSTTNTCQVTRTTSGSATYGVQATNAKGTGAPVTINVAWGGVSATGPLPLCTISASTATPLAGGLLTLTANCSQSPTKYNWTECSYLVPGLCANPLSSCSTASTTCTVSTSVVGFARYGVSGTNGNGAGSVGTVEVEWLGGSSGGGGPAPTLPVCNAYTSNPNPAVNTSIVLTASCSGNPTVFNWTGVSCSSTSCTTSSATTGTQTYSVTGSNAIGSSAPAPVSVTWGPPPPPSCALSASSTTPTVGQTVTIFSTCTQTPSSYAWSGCSSTGPNCTHAATAAGNSVYSLTASNVAGAGAPASITVNWQPAPTSAPVCTVSASSATPYVGQNVTLTASCNPVATSFAWTNCSSASSTCTTTNSVAGNQTYSVTGSNVIGTGAPASTVVNWQAAVGGADFCGSYSDVVRLGASWGQGPIYPSAYGGTFRTTMVLSVAVTVPASPSSYGTPGFSANLGEYSGTAVWAHATLSRSSCDFRPLDPSGVNGPFSQGYTASASVYGNVGAAGNMLPGQTYYINVKWLSPLTCPSSCGSLMGFQWPR